MDKMIDTKVDGIIDKIYSSKTISEEEHNEIIFAMKNGNSNEKIRFARILSRLKDPNDFKYIKEVLNIQNHSLILIEAAAMYGNIAIEQLKPMLETANTKKYLRENIIRIFVLLGVQDVEDTFIKYLNDDFIGVRKACIHGIEKLKIKRALKPLEVLISNEIDGQVKKYAQTVYNSLL